MASCGCSRYGDERENEWLERLVEFIGVFESVSFSLAIEVLFCILCFETLTNYCKSSVCFDVNNRRVDSSFTILTDQF